MENSSPSFTIKNLEETDKPQLRKFSCGNSSMDSFLYNEANTYHVNGEGITKLLLHEDQIIAYCTAKAWLWKIYDPEMYDDGFREIPCVEVSRLGVHTYWQYGQNGVSVGVGLMSYLILFVKNYIANEIGCRLITIHAIRSKVPWYEKHFGFVITNPEELESSSDVIAMHLDLIQDIAAEEHVDS
ncbi:MAG: hypothetical protein ABFD08_09665 [Syntrophomonas sp.]